MNQDKLSSAIDYFKDGKWSAAADAFYDIKDKLTQPKDIHACAVAFFKDARFSDAQILVENLISKIPQSPALFSLLGDVTKAQGDKKYALKNYKKAVEISPNQPELRFNLALFYYEEDNFQQSIYCLDEALNQKPSFVKALVLLGRCYSALEMFDEAEKVFRKACDLEPDNYSAHYRLGRLYTYTAKLNEADAELKKSLDLYPQLKPAYEAIILNNIYSGKLENVTDVINKALIKSNYDSYVLRIATDWAMETQSDDPFLYYKSAWSRQVSPNIFSDYVNRLILSSKTEAALKLIQDYEVKNGQDLFWETANVELLIKNQGYEEALNFVRSSKNRYNHTLSECIICFALGNYSSSLACANSLLGNKQNDQYFRALSHTALRCLDDPKYKALADYDNIVLEKNLIDNFQIEGQFKTYLQNLASTITKLHITESAPINQSVKGGTQTPGNLFIQNRKNKYISELREIIMNTAKSFFSRFDSTNFDQSHPISVFNPQQKFFRASWSIRTTDGGFHMPHVHTKGWYSSACYIDLPDTINNESEDGYLALGKPPFEVKDSLETERKIKPELGKLVLFPSYVWHSTLPFSGDGNRLVVAFDIGGPNTFV
tara:strand:+ start:84 stop:1892 length:1809 start_codon:yes stop_codon:yes gene_type:complete